MSTNGDQPYPDPVAITSLDLVDDVEMMLTRLDWNTYSPSTDSVVYLNPRMVTELCNLARDGLRYRGQAPP